MQRHKLENPKLENRNPKQIQTMKNKYINTINEEQHQTKQYDLEDRTFEIAKRIRANRKLIPKTVANIEDTKQVVRASGSVGAHEPPRRKQRGISVVIPA